MDCSSSLDYQESALDVSTCLAPTHGVFSVYLERRLLPEEHLSLQGIWRCDAESVEAYDELVNLNNGKLAKDIAGNSFSATVAQAAFITSLITCDAWRDIGTDRSAQQTHSSTVVVESSAVVEPPQLKEAGDTNRSTKNLLVPTRRLRRKTTLVDSRSVKRQRIIKKNDDKKRTSAAAPVITKFRQDKSHSGNKRATGKKPMVSITQKYKIMSKYEEALNRGDKHPVKAVEDMPGYFSGCVYESKWGHVYREQRWDVFAHTAPRLCQQFKELPNALRRILKMKTMKHGDGSSEQCQSESYTSLPGPLKSAIETMLLARIDSGEEINIHYVQKLMQMAIGLWNQSVQDVKADISERCMDYIRQQDDNLSRMSPAEVDSNVNNMIDSIQKRLKPVDVKQTDGAIMSLGCKCVVF